MSLHLFSSMQVSGNYSLVVAAPVAVAVVVVAALADEHLDSNKYTIHTRSTKLL